MKRSDTFFFRRAAATKSEQLIRKILDAKDWPTWNGQTVRRVAGHQSHRRFVAKNKLDNKREDFWVCGLVPIHQLVLQRNSRTTVAFYTVGIYETAVLGWPVKKKKRRSRFPLSFSPDARPQWYYFCTYKDLYVSDHAVISPLRLVVEQKEIDIADACISAQLSEAQPLMLWQSHHGFANVSEYTLLKALVSEKINPPEPTDDDKDYGALLALCLIDKYMPAVPDNVVRSILHHRVDADNEEETGDYYDEPVDEDALLDCCERNDQLKSKIWKRTMAASKLTKATRRKMADHIAYKRAGAKGNKVTPAAASLNKMLKRAKAHTKEGKTKWLATVVLDSAEIQQLRPPSGGLHCDPTAGRVMITYAGGRRKSIAWTLRGPEAARDLALTTLWAWHFEATGEEPPQFPFLNSESAVGATL